MGGLLKLKVATDAQQAEANADPSDKRVEETTYYDEKWISFVERAVKAC